LLQNIRDKSTGWIAYVIVIGISIPFALWGIDQYFTSNNVIVAEINDTKISLERLNNEYQGRLQEMQSLISKDQSEAELQKKIIKRTVLDELIDSVLVREFVNKNKFQVTEKSLIADIKNNKIFHENNKFNPKRYQNLLQSQGINISDYERIRTSELKTLQFYNNIVEASFITTQQLEDLENLKYQKRNFKLLSLSYKDFVKNDKKSTEKQKKDFYVKYRNIFSMPEKFDIQYIVFNKEILKKQLNINLSNLENYYNENKFKYIIPEKRKVSQIFLSNLKNDKEKNSKLIKLIFEKINNGETFEVLARKYSNDKLSNKKNGDIGWVSRNEIAKKISDEVFTIKNIEGISGIVEVESGFYLLKLKGLKEAKVKSFSEVKDAVKKDYENIQVVNKYDEIFEDLSNILFENPDSLINVEEYLSVKKISTGLSTLSKIKKDHKILNNQKVLESLSSQSVSNDNQNSAPIEVKDNIVMLRINNKSPVEYKKYEDVKKEVESLINTENAIESMNESIKNIETKIKEGADIKDIENLINKKSTYYSDIERADNSIPPSILTKVFSLTKDNNVTSIESGTGNYELIVLDSIEKGESDLSRKSLKTMFYNEQVNAVLYSVIQSLREQAKIKIYPKNL
jgi:peptidyl-prolyl cis-trans isomerase D